MGGRYHVIDEVSKSILGTFESRGEAVDFVAAAMSANAGDFLDELTVSNDTGPLLYGDTLRDALRHRAEARERAAAGRSNSGSSGYEPSVDAMAAKGQCH